MAYLSKEYNDVIKEYFDMTDFNTRKILLNVNEAGQSGIMNDFSSMLYRKIQDKVADIDFGSIPASKGDIGRVDGIESLIETIELMVNLIEKYKESPYSIQIVLDSIANIRDRKPLFEKAFALNLEVPILIYNTMVLSVFGATNHLITSTINYIKSTNDDTYQMVIDKNGMRKSKDYILFKSLEKFNKACKKGDIDKIVARAANARGEKKLVNEVGVIAAITTAGVIAAGIMLIVPVIKEVVYFFYYAKVQISDYLNTQADVLQANMYAMEADETVETEKKRKVGKKQSAIVDSLKKWASKVEINEKQAERKAEAEVKAEPKNYKINDVIDSVPDSYNGPSLF